MRYLLVVATALFLSLTTAFAADPVGNYRVEGSNPGNGSIYSGTVTVERSGDIYRVSWVINNQRFVGTGIGSGNIISVAYRAPATRPDSLSIPRMAATGGAFGPLPMGVSLAAKSGNAARTSCRRSTS